VRTGRVRGVLTAEAVRGAEEAIVDVMEDQAMVDVIENQAMVDVTENQAMVDVTENQAMVDVTENQVMDVGIISGMTSERELTAAVTINVMKNQTVFGKIDPIAYEMLSLKDDLQDDLIAGEAENSADAVLMTAAGRMVSEETGLHKISKSLKQTRVSKTGWHITRLNMVRTSNRQPKC
jgi:hypothetical protein